MKTIVWIMGFLLLVTAPSFAAKNASDYFALGTQLYNSKDYQGSYYAFEAGLVLDPNSAPGYQGLGDSLYFLGRQSDALAAYQKSLLLNPNNPKLASFVKGFKPIDTVSVAVMAGTPAVTSGDRVTVTEADMIANQSPDKANSQGATVAAKPDIRLALDKGMWVRGYVGYDFALLGDLTTGVDTLASNNSSAVTGTAQTGNGGILGGVEFGIAVDPGNAFSICIENVWTQTDSFSNGVTDVTDPNATYDASFSPELTSISLNYYAFIPGGKGDRTYLQFGAGLYQAVVAYTGFNPSTVLSSEGLSPNETGSFTASGFGGTVGVGETFAIDKSFALDISARGRIATFQQLTAAEINRGGTPSTDGPYAIGVNTGNGSIGVVTVNPSIGGGYRYAVLDYSGFDANLSLNYYF